MTDLIPLIKTNLESEEATAVDARTLHEFLEVKTPFKDWVARRLRDYDFVEGKDFCTFLRESSGGRPAKEYYLSLDMAKHVAMVERNQKGREAREYFIACEKALELESKLHRKFSSKRIRGEWFKVNPEKVIKKIEKL